MRCMNCKRDIPETAKICSHCEAPVMAEPSPEEIEAARVLMNELPPEAAAELRQAFLETATAEEFTNRILCGTCPKCGSKNTGDCEDDPDMVSGILVARCYDCGQLWCTDCEKLLDPKTAYCECWDEE